MNMLRSLIILVLLAVPSLATPQDAKQEVPGHGLSGAVHDTKGQPVVGAWLEVRAMKTGAITAATFEGAPFKSMRSGKDGRWAFENLTEGTWLLSVVASTEPTAPGAVPLTDEDLQKMARPGPDYRVPAGVALTRIVRHFGAGQVGMKEQMDLGLALGPRPARPLLGQLVAAFDPDKFGYEVRLQRGTLLPGGVSMSSSETSFGSGSSTTTSSTTVTSQGTTTSSSKTVDGVSDPPNPQFSVVPDRDGFFDFGSLEVKDEDWVSVETVPLAATGGAARGTPFHAPIGVFEPWPIGIEIAVGGQHTITMKAARADGKPLALTGHEWISCDLWSEGRVSSASTLDASGREVVLKEGTYLARAKLGASASAVTAFKIDASGSPTEVTLVLQPCPPFTVHFVDAKGAPLGDYFVKLGTEASKDFPERCRVPVQLESGEARLEGVLPGTYDVEFRTFKTEPFIRRLELKPDDVPVVVAVP